MTVRFYAICSVLLVSAISLVGVTTLGIKTEKLKKIILYFVSFSVGALMGDVFIHLVPQIIDSGGWTIWTSRLVLSGILFGLITEKIIHRNHCHMPITKTHVHPFVRMNIIGDIVHNCIDGLIIGASYLVSIPVGVATTLAVVFHEIPHEMWNFGVLIHGGFSKKRALLLNFLTALTSILGVLVALILGSHTQGLTMVLLPFAAGSFIYIAGSDLVPELHKENEIHQVVWQLIGFLLGVGVMSCILLLE